MTINGQRASFWGDENVLKLVLMVAHFGFDLYISLMISDIEHLFIHILAICIPSGEISVQILCPYKIEFCLFITEW